MRRGTVTYAKDVRPGDEVLDGGSFVVVNRVHRAQGRKPPVGENLRFVTDGHVLKFNSTAPVRVRRRARSAPEVDA